MLHRVGTPIPAFPLKGEGVSGVRLDKLTIQNLPYKEGSWIYVSRRQKGTLSVPGDGCQSLTMT